jgi:two-component system, LytTR family, sensor kinase
VVQEIDITRIVNTSILQGLPDAFYEATGLATALHDLNGEQITTIPPGNFCRFCRNMYFSREGHRRCVRSNRMGEHRAYETGKPYIYHCHSFLVDVAAPIVVSGHHVGSVSCGQILLEPLTDGYRRKVRRSLQDFPQKFQDEQMQALEETVVLPLKRVQGLAQLLSAIANNIVSLIISNIREKETNLQNVKLIDEIRARALLEKEIKNAQLNLKDAELKALQAQINPHFLYNTLDSIQWLAVMHGAEDIRQAIQSLGQLLRHSLDRKSTVVSVAKEIEQVRNYLVIQKIRYGDKVQYGVNVEPEVMDFQLPKLVLQPLVENAIQHGVEPKSSAGTIRIDGWLHGGEEAILEVVDDGVGMDDGTLAALARTLAEKEGADAPEADGAGHQRLGLVNVHKRLRYLFGDEYGLEVSRAHPQGVRIKLRIPRTARTARE